MFNEKTLDSRQMSAPGFYSLLLWQRLDDALTWAEFQTQTLEKKKRRNGEDAWMAFPCLEFGGMSLACQKAVQFYKFEMFDSSFPYLNKFC